MTVQQAFDLALQHHQAGRLAEAEALYRQVLTAQPKHADSLHYLGVIAHQVGRHDLAVQMIGHAISLHPTNPAAYSNLGAAQCALGRLDEAIANYRRAVELKPDYADAHNNLGNALRERGRLDEAITAYRRVLQLNPNLTATHFDLGNLLRERRQFDEAIAAYRRVLALRPDFAEAHNNLGNTLQDQGRRGEAITAYRRAVELQPNFAEAHYNLGILFKDQGQLDEAVAAYQRALALKPDLTEAHNNLGVAYKARGQFDEAIVAYRQALALQPDFAEAHNNLGIAFKDRGRIEEAVAACRRALEIRPAFAEAHNNLGTALKDQGRLEEAIAAYRRALEIRPAFAEAHNNLGIALKDLGQLDEAIAAYRRALEIQPDFAEAHNNLGATLKGRGELDAAILAFRRALQLDPERVYTHSNLILALHSDPASDASAIAQEQRRWSERFAEPFKRFIRPHSNDRNPDRRLRIGYVSPDFRDHVVGRNVLPLFAGHDHRSFEIVCYSGVARPDELTSKFRQHAELWRSTLGVADDALAELIRQDGVDILVDLAQHSANHRLPVFARQPAPVQISFAGYPESTGLDTIEYRISDRWLESGMGSFPGRERVCLIDSFWCYDPQGITIEVNGLPAHESDRVSFGCLSNFYKCNAPVLRLWARVLRQIRNARLFILCAEGSHRERTLHLFQREGVEVGRIEFWTHCSRQAYLELYHRVDIMLDPFPYNGHNTSLDALWMGVPVVSLAGESRVSRGGLSILTNIGLPELVAHSEDNYVAIASQLAHDLPRLADLRRTLRGRMESSVLMDGPRFARSIEAAYRTMWQIWCAK